jgi:hypothetical protein
LATLWPGEGARSQANRNPQTLPLKVSHNGRYLVDQENTPFLVLGDTAWSLIVQPDTTAIDLYLQDRQARGFDSIIVNLLEHKFCSAPPATRAGLMPFESPGDFSTPNPRYFDFAHQVIEKANQRGLVVWLAPAYLGYGGGDEGFFREMKGGGKQTLRAYGQFVGKRFKDLPNIVWLLGGDYIPEQTDRWTVTELAAGIRQQDTNHLMTIHASPEHSAAAVFGQEPWLKIDTVYSYQPALFRPLLAEYALKPIRPFVLIESTYEAEHNSTPPQIRRQAYWAMLAGACGQFLGNNPIWHFDGPGLFPVPHTWVQALDSVGSQDIARLGALFRKFPWEQLCPEKTHLLVTNGYGNDTATALTACTPDRKLSLTYIPSTGTSQRELTLDTTQFPGGVSARWFNPTTGLFTTAKLLPRKGSNLLLTPGDNGTQANDWVLVVEADQPLPSGHQSGER